MPHVIYCTSDNPLCFVLGCSAAIKPEVHGRLACLVYLNGPGPEDTCVAVMKKVSTGERIKFADLRRRSVGGPRGDADSDVMSEQRFVSELMDTTPSSSYEGDLREGLPYNAHDASVSDSPLPRYDSDGEAADEVVTGTQDGVSKTDLIVKEDVPEVQMYS